MLDVVFVFSLFGTMCFRFPVFFSHLVPNFSYCARFAKRHLPYCIVTNLSPHVSLDFLLFVLSLELCLVLFFECICHFLFDFYVVLLCSVWFSFLAQILLLSLIFQPPVLDLLCCVHSFDLSSYYD